MVRQGDVDRVGIRRYQRDVVFSQRADDRFGGKVELVERFGLIIGRQRICRRQPEHDDRLLGHEARREQRAVRRVARRQVRDVEGVVGASGDGGVLWPAGRQ